MNIKNIFKFNSINFIKITNNLNFNFNFNEKRVLNLNLIFLKVKNFLFALNKNLSKIRSLKNFDQN